MAERVSTEDLVLSEEFRRFLREFPLYGEGDEVQAHRVGDHLCLGYNTNRRRSAPAYVNIQLGDSEKPQTSCFILSMGVREGRKGYGTKLYGCVESFCRSRGCLEIITTPSGQGVGFWPKIGFVRLSDMEFVKRL